MSTGDDYPLSFARMTLAGCRPFDAGETFEDVVVLVLGFLLWAFFYARGMASLSLALGPRAVVSASIGAGVFSLFLTVMYTRATGSPLLNLCLPTICVFAMPPMGYDLVYTQGQSLVTLSSRYTNLLGLIPGILAGAIPIVGIQLWYAREDRSEWEQRVMPGDFDPGVYLLLGYLRSQDPRVEARGARYTIVSAATILPATIVLDALIDRPDVGYETLGMLPLFAIFLGVFVLFLRRSYRHEDSASAP